MYVVNYYFILSKPTIRIHFFFIEKKNNHLSRYIILICRISFKIEHFVRRLFFCLFLFERINSALYPCRNTLLSTFSLSV